MRGNVGRLLVLLVLLVSAAPAIAVEGVAQGPVVSPAAAALETVAATSTVTLDYPVGMSIAGDLSWDSSLEPDTVSLTYTVAGDSTEHLAAVEASIIPGRSSVKATASLNLQNPFVPSGIALSFTWRLERQHSVVAASEPGSTNWYDTRMTWATVSTDQVRVHSYALSEAFATRIRDSGQRTVTELEQRFGLDRSAPLDIWVYANVEDLLGAQQANSRESIAGASYPGFDLIVALIPEGSDSEILRIIPHEVSHQILYQATRNPFTYPPIWFDEGMATHMQTGGTDRYLDMVKSALADGELFGLASLEETFPYTPAQATLAYAASWSAIAYIQHEFGDVGIAALIAAYSQGLSNEDAVHEALGVSVEQLSADWHAWIASGAPGSSQKDWHHVLDA